MKKQKLLMLVNDRCYIRSNCYQRQLAETLEQHYDVSMIGLREIKHFPWRKPSRYDRVLSVLRQRTIADNLSYLQRYMEGTPLFIYDQDPYDQDPWQAYMDDSPWKGCYPKIMSSLNVQGLLLTTKWWTDYVSKQGIPARFVRMGMLPRYCDAGPSWEERQYPLGFQGTIHTHRKVFFDQLSSMGLRVDVLKSVPYEGYLENLHKMQIYIHTEDAPWQVDGKIIPRNALWIKDTEVAARGTFAIRDHEDESACYDIKELPTIYTYKNVSDIPSIIQEIRGMDPVKRNKCMRDAAQRMKERDDWMTVVRAMEAG